ncbi:MAG: restriction endonuclease [Sedimentisphaerales bacterium]
MTSNEYEKLTADIVGKFKSHMGNNNILVKCGKNNKWKGASTHNHQIDISVEYKDKIYIVECKRYKQRINVANMLVLVGRIKDIQANEKRKINGIFFTTKGYQGGAKKVAKYFQIVINTAMSIDEFAAQLAEHVIIGTQSLKLGLQLHQPEIITSNNSIQRTEFDA